MPDARANLAPIPASLTDEDVLLCPDIFSTGLSGAAGLWAARQASTIGA